MFLSLWRRLRNRNPVLPRGKCPRGGRHLSYRPGLEPLEDRALPALWAGGLFAFAPVPSAVSGPSQTAGTPPGGATQTSVTVQQNSPETVIDLGAVFGAMPALRPGDGLKLAVLGNTNSALVQTDLSGAALTLTYARERSGTAVIAVGATDADGVSVQQSLVVTVQPPRPAGTVGVAPVPPGPQASRPLGSPVKESLLALFTSSLQVDRPLSTGDNTGR